MSSVVYLTDKMIFLVGDTHGTNDIFKLFDLVNKFEFTKNDYVIIVGDAGVVWNKSTLEDTVELYNSFPFTTLYIDGNHENFNLLNAYNVEEFKGGNVHKIADSVYHLMRGQVFEIEGKTFFTFGGANSTDKMHRIENVSWWKDEEPNPFEVYEALENLSRYEYKVDYVLTHCIDQISLMSPPLSIYGYRTYRSNIILDEFENRVNYKHWYCGHYHIDFKVNDKKTILFDNVVCIDD